MKLIDEIFSIKRLLQESKIITLHSLTIIKKTMIYGLGNVPVVPSSNKQRQNHKQINYAKN